MPRIIRPTTPSLPQPADPRTVGLNRPATVPATGPGALGFKPASVFVNGKSLVGLDAPGRNDPSLGTGDPTVGQSIADHAVGMGELGPQRDKEAVKARADADKANESPSYLKGPAKAAEFSMAADLKSAKATLATLPLTAGQKEALLKDAGGSLEFGHQLAGLVAGTKGLAAEARASALGMVADDPKGAPAKVLAHVVGSPAWEKLSTPEREKLVTVLQAGNEKGMRLMGALIESRPEALRAADRQGGTLLSNLARLATQPMNSALYSSGLTRERLLQDVLRDVTNPDHIDQGSAPTCTVTSMQFELARDNPAEYTRLMAGITGPSGAATMAGGGKLALQPDYVIARIGDGRATAEVLFQSAAMEFANGADSFVAKKGISEKADGTQYKGLFPGQQTALLQQLFGAKYLTQSLETPAQAKAMLDQLRGYSAAGVNRPVLLEVDEGAFNHVVTYEKASGGKVFYRDPYGHESSMTEAAFKKNVVTVHLPDALG
jgi:hypothetical protein